MQPRVAPTAFVALILGSATAYMPAARSAVHLGQHSSRVSRVAAPLAQLRDQEQKTSLPSLKGFFGVVSPSPNAKASAPAAEEEADEMSIGTMLREYGLIALAFHFTVWATCLATVYSALTFGVSPESLPEFLQPDADGGAAAAGALGRVAATLGVVEAIGPARLALTVAATPKVSEVARQYSAVREAEAVVGKAIEGLLARLPGDDERS